MGKVKVVGVQYQDLIAVDRLSICAPQHNPICDWLGLAGWLLQMGSSSPLVTKRTTSSSVTTNIQRKVRYDWEEERPEQDYLKHPGRDKRGVGIIMTITNGDNKLYLQ